VGFLPMDQFLWWASIGSVAFALAAICARGAARRFPFFVAYLAINLGRDLLLKAIPGPRARPYAITWIATQPIILTLWILVALEVYKRICEHYPGIGTFARRLLPPSRWRSLA